MIQIADNRLDVLVRIMGRSVLAAVIAGFVFGIISLVMNLILQNHSLAQIRNIQWIANILLIIVLTAVIAVMLSGSLIKNLKMSIVPGCISGFVLVFTVAFFSNAATLVQMSPIFVPSDGYTMFDHFMENPIGYFVGFFTQGSYILIVFGLIAAIIVGIVGLAYWWMMINHGESYKKAIVTILAAMLIVLIITPVIGFTGLHMGWIEKSYCEYIGDYADTITVSRAGEDMIYVNYTASWDLELDSQMPIMIYINGKNATNMEAIRQSRLNVSISPSEGLKNVKGSYVELSGSDLPPATHYVADDMYNGTLIMITYVRYNGAKDVIIDCYV